MFLKENESGSGTTPVYPIFALIIAIFIVNYFAIKSGVDSGALPLVVFVASLAGLFLINPLYAFVFCFVLHVDLFSCFNYNWAKLLTTAGMYLVFINNSKSLTGLFKNAKLKALFFLGLLFGIYIFLINIGFKEDLSSDVFLGNFGTAFGFLTIMPAYFITLQQHKRLFSAFAAVAAAFLFVYYLDLIKGFGIFNLVDYARNEEAKIERLAGYDIRQFVIFFFYLIPAVALTTNIKGILKYFLISVGVFSFVILILAFYRLAMFYVVMGTFLSYLFIRKYADTRAVLKYMSLLIVVLLLSSFFWGEYLEELLSVFQGTLDYFSGKAVDKSADTRIDVQLPILNEIINSNWWTGIGIIAIKEMQQFDVMAFVDMPLLGTFAAFGFIGMILYYLKFIVLLSGNKKFSKLRYIDQYPFEFYVCMTLRAYIITMITFRLFYISWELTMVYQQAEFGLFAGAFLALGEYIKNSEANYAEVFENETLIEENPK